MKITGLVCIFDYNHEKENNGMAATLVDFISTRRNWLKKKRLET